MTAIWKVHYAVVACVL